MEAKRRGPCAACATHIEAGEIIHYEDGTGPRHLACADRAPDARVNKYRAPCSTCGVMVKPGKGVLRGVDVDGRNRWVVMCQGCVTGASPEP